jgi:hypothetical protein
MPVLLVVLTLMLQGSQDAFLRRLYPSFVPSVSPAAHSFYLYLIEQERGERERVRGWRGGRKRREPGYNSILAFGHAYLPSPLPSLLLSWLLFFSPTLYLRLLSLDLISVYLER